MLNDPRSHGLWEITAPPAPETLPLAQDATADVVVVGAGYTGLSTALHLAERGVRVIVLEAAEIGFGGSGRNVGLVNAGLWVMPETVSTLLGPERGNKLLDLLSEGPRYVFDLIEKHGIDCEALQNGTLHLGVGASGRTELEERERQWKARGAPVELLSAEETHRRTGSPRYTGALLDHRAGTIQPLAYARGLARAAIAAGATIHTHSQVTGYTRSGAGWRVNTAAGSVQADWVVPATNEYTSLGKDSPWPQIREETIHFPFFQIATKPLSDNLARSILPGREGCWDTRTVMNSVRFDKANRLLIGSIGALRGTGLPVHRRWARRTLEWMFPQLADIGFEAEWYGKIGMTSDDLPRLHQLDERVVSFSSYNGRGISPGTTFGRLLAHHILGEIVIEDLPLPVTEAEPGSFRTVREQFYELGAQIAHL